MGWLICLLIAAVLLLPLGVRVTYGEAGPGAKLLIGPAKLTLYPAKIGKEKKRRSKPKAVNKGASQQTEKKSGSLTDFLPLLYTVLDFLKELRRKFRVRDLQILLVMAGDDPCDLAVNYGRGWAVLGNLMPLLEKAFVIQKRDLEVECDFLADKTTVIARLDLSITIGRILSLLTVRGIPIVRELLKLMKLRKGGAKA